MSTSQLPESHYSRRAKEYTELHDQVQTSVNLLDSLESFLSTFQKDLSAVAGQISELQDRSKDIEGRLKSRRRIEKPLSSLLNDITIPPALATLILDQPVGEPWIEGIEELELRLDTIKARSRVKAARDLAEVAEGLRIVAATKLRGFFLALFQPIRGSVTTNMQVIQTSVLLKYKSVYGFLRRHAPSVAQELQRSYIGAARVYYETGFRRYIRSLGWIKARTIEKHESIVSDSPEAGLDSDSARLAHSKIDGPGVTLAFLGDNKTYTEPLEALYRSLLLVFMDNATAEYTFVKSFFCETPPPQPAEATPRVQSPTTLLSPHFDDSRSITGSIYGTPENHTNNGIVQPPSKEEQAALETIWKQIMDPVLTYTDTFLQGILEPMPPVVPLLTMIRLTEDVVLEVQRRNCSPVEFFIFSMRLKMWPVFQKAMADNVQALKKLAEGGGGGYFSRAASTTDAGVQNISKRYTSLFNSFVALTEQEEETMIFSNLLRLRQELSKLILRHTNNIGDVVSKAKAQSAAYESIVQGLSRGTHHSAHPKSQQEIAYWANLEEEARRKIVTASRPRQH